MAGAGEKRVRELRERGDVAGLGRLLQDPDAGVRIEAAEALGEIGDPAAFDALIASIGAPSDDALLRERVRAAARVAMSRLGKPTSEQLRRLVDLGGSGPWEAMELIRQHGLRDDPLVGLWYRAATGDWGGADASSDEAMALIVANLAKPSYSRAAVRGLGAAGAPGVPYLVKILEKDGPQSTDMFGASLEKDAYEALCAIDAPEARTAAARHFAWVASGSLDDKVARLREGLLMVGGEEALGALVAELQDERPPRRLAAAQALGRLGDPRALPALEAALADPYRVVTVLETAPDSITDDFLREAMLRTREEHPVREAAKAAIEVIRLMNEDT